MDRVLVAGIESVVGANFAACFADRLEMFGISFSETMTSPACSISKCRPTDVDAIRRCLASFRPARILFCGVGSSPTWQRPISRVEAQTAPDIARIWANAASDFGCQLTWISSDSIFTGPWMFHSEDSQGLCRSSEAVALQAAEEIVMNRCPSNLIIRTHAFGWAGNSTTNPGWIEQLIAKLERESAGPFNGSSHGSPILASDLADILERAFRINLSGVYHIAGSERTNLPQFVHRLADVFELPAPRVAVPSILHERPTGFGQGECSLRTTKIRQALGIPMPLLNDGLMRLRAQRATSYCELMPSRKNLSRDKVA